MLHCQVQDNQEPAVAAAEVELAWYRSTLLSRLRHQLRSHQSRSGETDFTLWLVCGTPKSQQIWQILASQVQAAALAHQRVGAQASGKCTMDGQVSSDAIVESFS